MAKITIGSGFSRLAEEEEEMRKAAAALPADWDIEMSGDSTTGIFRVSITQPHGTAVTSFAPGESDRAVRYLQSLV